MTHRIAIAFILSLASARVVTGEEEMSLEEIESRTDSKIDVDDVTIYREGKEVSYDSLSRREREGLHAALDAFEAATSHQEGIIPQCEAGPTGFACWNDWVDCGCQYAPSGPKCYCDFDP